MNLTSLGSLFGAPEDIQSNFDFVSVEQENFKVKGTPNLLTDQGDKDVVSHTTRWGKSVRRTDLSFPV